MLKDNDVIASIGVKDMAAATKFYGETLGLEAKMETPGGTYFKSGSTGVFVYTTSFAGTNKATYASWNVKDVDGTVEELKSKGVTFEQYDDMPGMVREGNVHIMGDLRAAWFKDPDGNILNLVNQVG